ncbi:MAG: threonine/serine exporter family protein [Bacteroidales bacterium]|nr:threonine/serine exporter family protein [Bacteroidales bacterium]
MTTEQEQALQLATEAGHILLENGAEISRVEETMTRIASAYGVEEESFFVLSNGIIATGQHYARAEFIPIKGTQLAKVVEVNQLSRDVTAGECVKPMPVETLGQRILAIRTMPGKVWWEMTLGIALGVSSFSILFGGSLVDAAATLVAGVLLGLFMTFVSPHLSRLVGNVAGGLAGGICCIPLYRMSMHLAGLPQLHLANMIIGTIIALVPGVPFTNGMRDLANEDYIAGTTRLTDAFLAFLCIALGVALAFIIDGVATGGIVQLGAPVKDPVAAHWAIQVVAAFVGTVGFSALFGAPRRYYLYCGLAGMAGWAVYLLVAAGHSVVGAAFFAALTVAAISHVMAKLCRCPVTVFLICGIIPLVPGGGIFWTAYYIVTEQLRMAAATGFVALKVTIAIAGGIILASGIINKCRLNSLIR